MTDFKSWIRAAFVKAIKATAQTMIAAIPVGAAFGEAPWGYCLSVAGVAAILSLLTSLATLPVLDEDASAATKGDDEHVE